MDSTKNYVTTDVDLAAFLLTLGHKLINTKKRPDDPYLTFEFEDSERLHQDTHQFLNNTAVVSARALLENLRRVRILFHQTTRRGGDSR
jgi:hypothetical protein